MIKLEIIGNLGKDSEIKVINGKNYNAFPVAVSEGYGENKKTTWVNVMKFAGENDKLGQYLTKGTKVYVSGKPTVSAYTNKNNELSSDISLWANDIELVGGIQSSSQEPAPAPVESPQPAVKKEKVEIQNDLPF